MSFKADLADMAASIDDELGEAATWSGVADPVIVHFEEDDQRADWSGPSDVLVRARRLSVHERWVDQPVIGDTLTLTASGETLRVIEEPTRDRDGYWLCGVKPV